MNRLVAVINAGMDIFLTICAILLGLALVIYLFYKINKEKFRYVESGDTRYNYDEDKFKKFIDNKISNASKKTEFVLAKLEINDLSSIKKNLGDIQFSIFKKQFIVRLFGIYGFGTKICFSDNNILLYLRYENQFEDLSNIAKTIVDKMTEPFKFSSSLSLELSINVGVAGFPISGSTTEELLQNISLALLDSKRQGSNQFTIYNDSLKNMATDEYKYYLEIQQAIENKNFTVYYQPIVNIKTGEVFCGEGLLRWENPEKGVLSPSKFIGIMEQTGDIVWVGYWSFDSMTKTFATWQKNYPDTHFKLSVNLSMKQLLNTSFSEEVKKICRKNRVLPEDFIFELPNIETIEQFPEAKDTLQKIKQLGFNLAIDDFDMNINHFDDIKDLGISNIMIEYSYIEKVLSSDIYKSIFKALMDICNEENIYLTVENVETFEQIEELKKLKILFAQGYYFSEPKPLQKFISDVVMTPWEVKKSTIDKKIESSTLNTNENTSEAVGSEIKTDTITEPTQNATAIPQNSTDNLSLDKKENNANQENSSLSTLENDTSVDSNDSKMAKNKIRKTKKVKN